MATHRSLRRAVFDEPTLPFGRMSGVRFSSIPAAAAVNLFDRAACRADDPIAD